MSAKGNPKFSCPSILSHANSKSLGACSKTDSREKLFDSSLKTVNVFVNTEISMDLSYDLRKRVKDYLYFHGEMDYDDTSSIMSVDDLTYSTLFNDEVVDNGERHVGLNSCDTGLETCDELKPTRHGNELLDNSIQSATERGDSGIDKIAYLSGDDTGGTGHTQVYESSNNMLDSKSISENQSESDMDLVEDISSDDEIYSDTEDGEYFSAVESLEETLEIEPLSTSVPCTVVSSQIQCSLTDLDPSADFKSSEVPDQNDKWEDDDFDYCVFDEMPMEIYDQNAVHSNLIGFVSSSVNIVDYVEDILRRHSSLEHLLFAKSPDCDDTVSFCSILTDKLQYCQSDTPDSVRYFSNDSFKAMNPKQRFFDAAFNNEPCNGSTNINSCEANNAPKHQLSDAINSNIQNKNVLNIAEATAVSNIPSKVSRRMFFPKMFLQYGKDKYESYDNDNSYRKVPAANTYGITTISGKGNVEYVIVKRLIIRKDDVIPYSEIIVIMTVFYDHILYMIWKSYVNSCAGESEKVVLGNVIMKYYFPEVVNLVKEFVECYITIVIYCVMMVQKLKSLISILIGIRTMVRIAEMDIEMSMAEVGLGTVIMLKV